MSVKGIVLVHLGAPSDFTEKAAADFLRNFLGDRRVLNLPLVPRKFLAGYIAKKRAAHFAEILKEFSINGEMQTVYYAKKIAQALQEALSIPVFVAGVYDAQGLGEATKKIEGQVGGKLLFLILYPQISSTTTFAAIDEIKASGIDCYDIVCGYHDVPLYIEALAKSINERADSAEAVIASFHGVPVSSLKRHGYDRECEETLRLLRDRLPGKNISMAWQSVMPVGRWTGPTVVKEVERLLGDGVKNIALICPGFFCDCSETSLEIARELRNTFLENGGKVFTYIPCLNDSPDQIALLKGLCKEKL